MLGVKRVGLIAGLVMLGLAPAAAAHGAAAPSTQDRQFLESIHQVNLVEISTGNLAEQRAADPTAQTLGAQFVTDHARLDQAVDGAASSNGVTLPDAPTNEQVTVRDRLQNLNGTAFDKQWVSAQLTWETAAMQVTQTELNQGSDPAIKQIARDAAPVLKSHHDALVALAKKLGVPVPSVTSTTPGPGVTSGTPSPSGPSGTPSPSAPSGTPGRTPSPGTGSPSGAPNPSVTSNQPSPGAS